MTKRSIIIAIAIAGLTGGPQLIDRAAHLRAFPAPTTAASRDFARGPHTAGSVDDRLRGDIAAMERFRPGYEFWRNIYTIRDGSIAFGDARNGRLLAVFPAGGDWARDAKWIDTTLADTLDGHTLPKDLGDRRDYVVRLLERAVGPVLHNATRGGFAAPGARKYGSLLGEWGAIYERFGVPAEIGLAQALVESGFEGPRRSEADAVGLCQWLETNWKQLDRLDPAVLESSNQTTQAAYCAAYVSILATKYGSFIPALSAHHAGETNIGRILLSGTRLGVQEPRERYFFGAQLARDLRTIGDEYRDIYQSYGPRSYRYAEMVFGNTFTVREIIAGTAQRRVYAMRTTRSIPLAEVTKRTGLSADEVKRFNPALVKRVPKGATLYLPSYDKAFGRNVSFWRRPANKDYAAVLDAFVRLNAAPEDWDQRSFGPILEDFGRRFLATKTEEGTIMATVLSYVRQESMHSPRRTILAEFQNSDQIRDLFERGVHDREAAAVLAE